MFQVWNLTTIILNRGFFLSQNTQLRERGSFLLELRQNSIEPQYGTVTQSYSSGNEQAADIIGLAINFAAVTLAEGLEKDWIISQWECSFLKKKICSKQSFISFLKDLVRTYVKRTELVVHSNLFRSLNIQDMQCQSMEKFRGGCESDNSERAKWSKPFNVNRKLQKTFIWNIYLTTSDRVWENSKHWDKESFDSNLQFFIFWSANLFVCVNSNSSAWQRSKISSEKVRSKLFEIMKFLNYAGMFLLVLYLASLFLVCVPVSLWQFDFEGHYASTWTYLFDPQLFRAFLLKSFSHSQFS